MRRKLEEPLRINHGDVFHEKLRCVQNFSDDDPRRLLFCVQTRHGMDRDFSIATNHSICAGVMEVSSEGEEAGSYRPSNRGSVGAA